ncbi:MAG: CoA ester lyase [Desulforhabdus sp.]|jgi:citrate lyase beta subunit|nr:CoA ester lyase [Desulforhabdus sp.]
MERPIRLRRSILSVPSNREKMVGKASSLSADVIMLDLEDSVPVQEKEQARSQVASAFREGRWSHKVRAYRINGMDTPFAYRDIIEVVEAAGEHIDVIVVPKVNKADEIKAVDYLLTQIEMRMGWRNRIGLEASIETAEGMLRIEAIAFSSPRLEALVFGVADYSASLSVKNRGMSGHGEAEDFYPGHRWHFPLSRMAMAAKAAGLAAIDAPYGNYKDPAGLERSCTLSAGLGYDGKWAIHPDQLEIINDIYSPSEEDVERSRIILEKYREAQAKGYGSFSIEGKMIDRASVRLAQVVSAQWDAISRSSK